MELMTKRELKKLCKDMGMSRKEFREAYKSVYGREDISKGFGKAAAIGTLAGLSLAPTLALADSPPTEVEKVKEERKVSKFLTGTYYQGIKGSSIFRFEGGSDGLPLGLEAYGLLDLESKDKSPDFETLFGEFTLSKRLYKDLSVSTRPTVASGVEDVARLGLKYSPKMKKGDILTVEFYPIETDGKQTVYVYGLKKLGDGKIFVDVMFKGTLSDFKPEKFYTEISCGMQIGKGLEAVAQGRLGSGGYKAFMIGARYSF